MRPEKLAYARAMRADPTPAEHRMWEAIRKRALGVKFRRQHPMWGYIADFYSPQIRLCIEVDGKYHNAVMDALRDEVLAVHGIATIRFQNRELFENMDGVVSRIEATIRERSAEKQKD